MNTITQQEQSNLALHGGPKAFEPGPTAAQPKLGVAEFLAIARRFGFSSEALERLQSVVSDADLVAGGPNLARYACPHPAPPAGEQFEALAREMFDSPFALSVSSGTAALHAAMVAAGAGPGREVIVPALGFMATAAAAAVAGATPVFCDVDESLQIDPRKIEPLVTERTVAVVPTHHWGGVCDMDAVLAVARRKGLKVIEDCAQTPGASYRGRAIGTLGDLGCFSISAYKIIGGGEGGLVLARDEQLFDRVRQLAECGGLWRPNRFAPPRYEGELFVGTNYRMSELEAAVDVVQLGKLPAIVERTRRVRRRVDEQLKTFAQITPQKRNDPDGDIGYLLRFFPSDHELAGQIAEALRAEGVGVRYRGTGAPPDWHLFSQMFPMHSDPQVKRQVGSCPVADDLYDRCLGVGIDQWWSDEQADTLAAALNKVFTYYCDADPDAPAWR